MKIRIDLKIFIFLAIFYFTNQIKIYMIIMFFSFLHELGHIIAGVILKMKLEKIEILPCGFSSSFKENLMDYKYKLKNANLLELKKIIIAIAGPILSVILAILFTYIDITYITKQDAIYSNLLIAIFNLIPIYPLDGGRIIKGILHIELGKDKSEYIINSISKTTIVILTIISSIAVYCLKNVAIFLVCIFLWSLIWKEKNGKTLEILR